MRVKERTAELVIANKQLKKELEEHEQTEKEQDRLQAQLIHSEKMAGIGTLASGIAHEFNNLLQIMRGHTEFAQKTKKAEDIEEAFDTTFHYESLKKLDLVTAAIDGGFNRNITERRRAPNDALGSGDCSPNLA